MTATSDATRRAMVAPGTDAARDAAAAPWPGLGEAALAVGVELGGEQLARFAVYRDLLLARNTRTNLTAIDDPDEVERRLFLDAVVMLPAIDDARSERAGGGGIRLVDVGSGAGFPGLALKIARPAIDVTLVEATGKKAAFLDEVIAELGLSGAAAVHGRAAEVGHDPAHRGRYDLATARAVASLPALLELCAPLLRIGGRALFPKGLAIDEELAAAGRAAPMLGVRVAGADPLPGGTRLVRVDKIARTPETYPRRAGVPARDPLGAAGPRGAPPTARAREAATP